jgi:hypothetical protein
MSLAALSPETQIGNALRELDCAESNFAKIAGVVGKSRLAEGLAGQKDFERRDAEKMLAVLQEMRELRDASAIPPDWKKVDEIREALAARREGKKIISETSAEIVSE